MRRSHAGCYSIVGALGWLVMLVGEGGVQRVRVADVQDFVAEFRCTLNARRFC